jgi:hypothetical protein
MILVSWEIICPSVMHASDGMVDRKFPDCEKDKESQSIVSPSGWIIESRFETSKPQ